ncbi:hypothetical protein GGI43DRAFT_307682 [Trichoderma evansii]
MAARSLAVLRSPSATLLFGSRPSAPFDCRSRVGGCDFCFIFSSDPFPFPSFSFLFSWHAPFIYHTVFFSPIFFKYSLLLLYFHHYLHHSFLPFPPFSFFCLGLLLNYLLLQQR